MLAFLHVFVCWREGKRTPPPKFSAELRRRLQAVKQGSKKRQFRKGTATMSASHTHALPSTGNERASAPSALVLTFGFLMTEVVGGILTWQPALI